MAEMAAGKPDILYLGDTCLDGAAGYLAGLMSRWKLGFDYVPSDRPYVPPRDRWIHRLVILSDYPSNNLSPDAQRRIVDAVGAGECGLLMIGGWESFCGCGGDWAGTIIADALPAQIGPSDDRINCDQPALLRCRRSDHPIIAGLPWDDRPPTVGGFNRIAPKASADVLLEVERFAARRQDDRVAFASRDVHPMLIVGQHGAAGGRTAALATDVAPHWVGGLVDWGDDSAKRITAQAPGSGPIEVGPFYAKFFEQLIRWTGKLK